MENLNLFKNIKIIQSLELIELEDLDLEYTS